MIEYPRRTIVMGLFYFEEFKTKLIGYADVEYLSDPHKALSQARYVFACGGTIISWRSMKQMLLCRNKSPPWSKSKVRLVEINDTPYSRNVWFFFKKKNIPTTMYKDWRHHHKKLSDVLIRGSTIRVALFFPWSRFFPTGFSWQGF